MPVERGRPYEEAGRFVEIRQFAWASLCYTRFKTLDSYRTGNRMGP
jgi:hypothetical protein